MDDTRIHRRTRARPYDLRRKVLLKNFLRDQMMHIPETSTESSPNSVSSYDEPLNSDEESSTAEVNELASSFTVVDDALHSIPDSSVNDKNINHSNNIVDDMIDVETVDNVEVDVPRDSNRNLSHSPSLVKFTGLFKRGSKSTPKDIFKAKKFCKTAKSPMKTRSFKKSFERVFYGHKKRHEKLSSGQIPKNSRSLFSLFKHKREQRHSKEIDRIKRSSNNHISNSVPAKSSTINQSVQTDNSWVKEEMSKVHQSNKRLKEENKLLSESLSYFMSSTSIDPHLRQCSSPFQPSNKNENSLMFRDYPVPSSSRQDGLNSRSKVFRSKSIHEFNERHKMSRNNYRTKSMNVHNNRNHFLSNSRSLLSTYNDEANMPQLRKKSISTNISYSTSNRNIQRRSSMPERTLSENHRLTSHGRSNSMRNTHTRKPFYALSADAFY